MKPIAIAFSDIHLHRFKDFDKDGSRLDWSIKALTEIIMVAERRKVPLLFCGDMVHIPKEIDQTVLYRMLYALVGLKVPLYAISGNHDQYLQNTIENPSPSYIKTLSLILPNFHCLDMDCRGGGEDEFMVQGIPYMTNDKHTRSAIDIQKQKLIETGAHMGFEDSFKILMLHSDIPGATDNAGFEIGESKHLTNLDYLFAPWDLVLCGHIHKPQKIGNNVFMLGSPIHQNRGDSGLPMGYWEIYKEKEPIFVWLEDYPRFIPKGFGKPLDIDYIYDGSAPTEEWAEDFESSFHANGVPTELAKQYMKQKKIKSKAKRKLLTEILNQAR